MSRKQLFIQVLACLLLGIVNVLAFAPWNFWPVQLASLGWMFFLTLKYHTAPLWQHALRGWAFGLGWTATGMYWLYFTMYHYGHLPAWMAVGGVLLLASLYLAVFSGVALLASAWCRRRWNLSPQVCALLVMPAAWAVSEWLRGWVFPGLPWVVSGYAHVGSPLGGFAPLLGVYGIGGLAALLGGVLALALIVPQRKLAVLPLLLLPLVLGSGAALRHIAWSEVLGKPISVRLLQGNVSQDSKFDPKRVSHSFELYQKLIREAPADLIATPETAFPVFIQQLPPDLLPKIQDYSRQSGSYIAIGLLIADSQNEYTNSLIGITPQAGSKLYRYNKQHLVPLGEFVPRGLHWFVNMIGIPMSDQTPGAGWQAPWAVKDQWVLPNICYEDLFGEEIAEQMAYSYRTGQPVASILLNISNIAWFDDSLALPHHLQIAQMRAMELARPIIRATNTGATAIIRYDGSIAQRVPYLTKTELRGMVQGRQGSTPYMLYGNYIMLTISVAALVCAWLLRKKPITP
jgi:apolipoprotein N-acyltransferase